MPPLGPESIEFNEKTVVREEAPRAHDSVNVLALWSTLLIPPLATLVAQSAAYALVTYVCDVGWWPGLVHLPHALMLLTGAAAWMAALRYHRRFADAPGEGGGVEPRSRFLAEMATIGGPFFILIIVAMWLATTALRSCQ